MELYAIITEFRNYIYLQQREEVITQVHGYCATKEEAIAAIPNTLSGYTDLSIKEIENSKLFGSAKYEVLAKGAGSTRFKPHVKYLVRIERCKPIIPKKDFGQKIKVRYSLKKNTPVLA